jgi:hypothetical protein
VIFLGSIALFNYLILPALYAFQAKPMSGYQGEELGRNVIEREERKGHSFFVAAILGLSCNIL